MIPFTSIQRDSQDQWVFTWASTGAAYYRVILHGVQVDRVTDPTYTYGFDDYDEYPPPLEVVEEDDLALSEQHVPFLVMQWYRVDCAQYMIEEWDDPDWVERYYVAETGAAVYTLATPALPDGTFGVYRVIPMGTLEDEGEELEYNITVVCPPPDPTPELLFAYDGGSGDLTISEA